MAEHSALRATGRAGGVEDGGEIVARTLDILERGRLCPSGFHQAAFSVRSECLNPWYTRLRRNNLHLRGGLGSADEERRLGIAKEIPDFTRGVR